MPCPKFPIIHLACDQPSDPPLTFESVKHRAASASERSGAQRSLWGFALSLTFQLLARAAPRGQTEPRTLVCTGRQLRLRFQTFQDDLAALIGRDSPVEVVQFPYSVGGQTHGLD